MNITFGRPLSTGCSGADVAELQRLLESSGYNIGSKGVDGKFGKDTETAWRKYEQEHKKSEDVVPDGKASLKELNSIHITVT